MMAVKYMQCVNTAKGTNCIFHDILLHFINATSPDALMMSYKRPCLILVDNLWGQISRAFTFM